MLLDVTRWVDNGGASPPAVWTGSLYDFVGDNGATNTILATAHAGDVVGFNLNNLAPSVCPPLGSAFQLTVNGSLIYSYDLQIVGTDSFESVSLNDGDAVELRANTNFVSSYAVDFTVTPTASPAPAVPGPGFVLATGDTLSPTSGPGSLTTLALPALTSLLAVPASYVRAPWGMALVFYGGSAVYSLPLPEDVGLLTYENAPKQRYTWRSKKFVFPGQTTMGAAKIVHSCAGGGVRMRLFVDCCCVFESVVRGCVPFRLPAQLRGITWEIELIGCSRVTEVRLASSIRELMGNE